MKILFTFFNLFLLIINIYSIMFLNWIKDYKINWELKSFYSYMLLDIPIKKFYNSIEWQNIVIEKGSNVIIKEKNYMITKDTVISWIFEVVKNWETIKKTFNNLSIWELYNNQKELNNILITDFWKEKINEQIKLPITLIKSIIQWEYITWNYNEIN